PVSSSVRLARKGSVCSRIVSARLIWPAGLPCVSRRETRRRSGARVIEPNSRRALHAGSGTCAAGIPVNLTNKHKGPPTVESRALSSRLLNCLISLSEKSARFVSTRVNEGRDVVTHPSELFRGDNDENRWYPRPQWMNFIALNTAR